MAEFATRYGYSHSRRLHGRRCFARVYAARHRRNAGPLTVFVRSNGLPHARLGLSVSREVGSAVRRNRIKRLLREAFRLTQHDWPAAYDAVIVVRPHVPVALAEYRRLLLSAIRMLHREGVAKGQSRISNEVN